MNALTDVINYLIPLLGLILLLAGFSLHRLNYVLIAFWLSLLGLFLQYQIAGGEILGTYFDYKNAGVYTLNTLIVIFSLIYLIIYHPFTRNKYLHVLAALVSALVVTGGVILMINLWMNAYFIETKVPGTPIMQVVSFTPPAYCDYRYLFYKVGTDKKISYLCPNYYGLIPAIGYLDVAPVFLAKQLTTHQ